MRRPDRPVPADPATNLASRGADPVRDPRRTRAEARVARAAPPASQTVSQTVSRVAPQDFGDALYEQTRNAPWVAASVGFHALLFGVFALLPNDPVAPPPAVAALSMVPVDAPPVLPEPEPEPEPTSAIDPTPLDLPPVENADILPPEVTTETGRPDETGSDELVGDPTVLAMTAFADGASNDASIGIGASNPGRFGRRGIGRRGRPGPQGGGSPLAKAPPSVAEALSWLARHQSPDGRWDADGFSHRCAGGTCGGHGSPVHDAGLTGLALLCFLGNGYTHQSGEYAQTVRDGLRWLTSVQDPEGVFGPRTGQGWMYDHSIATLAVVEAYGMTGSVVLKPASQKGIDLLHRARNPYAAWRYGIRDGDNDTSVTGWAVMALKSAKLAGLDTDPAAFQDALAFVDRMTDPEFGKVGYQTRGGQPARTAAMTDRFPADRSESLTAVGVLTRFFCGQDVKEPAVAKGLSLMRRRLPHWDPDAGTIDMYYWYYGTLAAFQAGGEIWKEWNAALGPAVIDRQRREKDLCVRGSWDPEDPWAEEGGRVYSTAMMCLCLEAWERYHRVSEGDGARGAEAPDRKERDASKEPAGETR